LTLQATRPIAAVLLLSALGALAFSFLSETRDDAPSDSYEDTKRQAGLTGRKEDAEATVNPLAGVTDVRTILESLDTVGMDAVVERLAQLGTTSPDIVALLVELLREEYDVERSEKAWSVDALRGALAAIGKPAVPALVKALDDDEDVLRRRVALVVKDMGEVAAQSVPVLLARLDRKERDVYVRNAMIEALGGIGPSAKPALPWLHGMTRDKNQRTALRCKTADALFAIEGASDEVFETWRIVLIDGGPDLRQTVLEHIGKTGVDAQPMMRAVLTLLAEEDSTHQEWAIYALQAMESEDERVLRALRAIFEDESAQYGAAANALASLGYRGREVLWERVAFTHDHGRVVGVEALAAQGGDPDRLVDLLLPALESENHGVNTDALRILSQLKPRASVVFPALDKRVLHDTDGWLRVHAVALLGSLREPTKASNAALLSALNDTDDVSVYQSALSGIDGTANPNREVFDIVVNAARSSKWGFMDSIRALGTYSGTPHAKDAVGALVDALERSTGGQAIVFAAQALELHGRTAESALPALRAARAKFPQWTYVTDRVDSAIKAIQ